MNPGNVNNTAPMQPQQPQQQMMAKPGMAKSTIYLIIAVVFLGGFTMCSYNGLVSAEETVEKGWSNVEAQYQRRADLIPNLVNVVKGYAKHEKSTFEEVTKARASVGQIKIDPSNMTEEDLQKFQQAQEQVGSALNKLIAVGEAYPELKANENFRDLQAQLEGTENRVTKAVTDYNSEVQTYNTTVRRFPKSIFASIFGFEKKPHFKAKEGADQAPNVNFD